MSERQDTSGPHQTHQDKSRDNEINLRHCGFLVDRMSPEFGLIDKLFSNDTLSKKQKNQIEAEAVTENRNEILIEYIFQKNACKELFEALKESGQSHLVKYLEEDGEYKPEFGGNWPLMEKESAILKGNYEHLIDMLDSRDLVGLLYQTGVLNKRQRNLINSKGTSEEQNKVMLEILLKGSLDDFWQTIRCLHLSNQSHIARIFESGGVVVRIDANLPPELPNLTEIENSLATEITNLLRNTPHSEASRIWEKVQLNLVGAAAKYSISLYFLCTNERDIDRIEQMTSDGQLKNAVEYFFNRLMEFPTRIKMLLKWPKDLFALSRNYIRAAQIENFVDEPRKSTFQCLPLELLDTILQSAYLWLSVRSGVLDGAKDSDLIMILASVDTSWFQRILRKRFKKSILLQLERIYRREFEMFFSFRGCLRYLEETIQVADVRLTRKDLIAADCFTDQQSARLLRNQIMNRKQLRNSGMLAPLVTEISALGRGLEEGKIYNNFIYCLLQFRQAKELRVLEEGGATAKVEIRRPKNNNTDAWSREFSSRLNNSKDTNQLKSDDMKKIIQQMKNSGLEILNSFVDRGVSVWIWCKSQNSVETLTTLYESQTLIDNLYRLGDTNDRNRSNKDIHLEELSQLKIYRPTLSLGNIILNVEGELRIRDDDWPTGATKLRNKIFVIECSSPSHLYIVKVCDDQYPFSLQRKMKFKQIKSPTDFSSFEKDFCLYIADIKAKCIWKIRPPDEDKIKDGKYTCIALKCPELSKFEFFRMTITDEGQILIIGDRKPILLFYKSESTLNNPIRIDLPDAIYRPEQVAENSAGNFIFLHRTTEKYYPHSVDQWAVSEVDPNGRTIIRRHVETGNQWLKPGGDAYLLVGSEDRVLLSDTNNHRLIFLDSRLRYIGSFTTGIELEEKYHRPLYPREMFIDGEQSQLIVVGRDKAFVYNISRFYLKFDLRFSRYLSEMGKGYSK